MNLTRSLIGLGMAAALVAAAEGADATAKGKPAAKAAHGAKAVAAIASKSDSHVTGQATFEQAGKIVTLTVSIQGADPGPHAVHLHDKGDCSAADGTSAGGHWNPTKEDHGRWGTPPFHRGDIGVIDVGADGKGTLTMTTDLWSVGGDPSRDVVGHAVIVHAKTDDFTTQPTGNAGGRVGCGVVELAH